MCVLHVRAWAAFSAIVCWPATARRARCLQVASVLAGLTRALSSKLGTHGALLTIYRDAWPRFTDATASGDVCGRAHIQRVLSGSPDGCMPPARCFDFLVAAAHCARPPPGLRLFLIIAATLASAAQAEDPLAAGGDAVVDSATLTEVLRENYLQSRLAHETLIMPCHLRVALVAALCAAQGQAAGAAARRAVHALNGDVAMACAGLVSHAPTVLLASQLRVGHVLAEDVKQRRAVIAARLPLSRGQEGSVQCSSVRGVAIGVKVTVSDDEAPQPTHVGMFVAVRGASEDTPKRITVCFGLAVDSEAVLEPLVEAAQQWCSGRPRAPLRLQARQGLWATHASEAFVVTTADWGYNKAFTQAESEALGYPLDAPAEAVVFACCEWPPAAGQSTHD